MIQNIVAGDRRERVVATDEVAAGALVAMREVAGVENPVDRNANQADPAADPAADPEAGAEMALVEFFRTGGPVMWPLLLCSLVSVAIAIEKTRSLRLTKVLDPTIVERITGLLEGGRADRALAISQQQPGIFTNIISAGLEQASKGEGAVKEAIEDAGRHEAGRLTAYLNALGTIVGISPLLGLFGTVTGMIKVFQTIAEVGTGNASQLSDGISQALITTATGLLIAIPSLVAYNFFQGKAERLLTDIERASLRVLRTLYPADGFTQTPASGD